MLHEQALGLVTCVCGYETLCGRPVLRFHDDTLILPTFVLFEGFFNSMFCLF